MKIETLWSAASDLQKVSLSIPGALRLILCAFQKDNHTCEAMTFT